MKHPLVHEVMEGVRGLGWQTWPAPQEVSRLHWQARDPVVRHSSVAELQQLLPHGSWLRPQDVALVAHSKPLAPLSTQVSDSWSQQSEPQEDLPEGQAASALQDFTPPTVTHSWEALTQHWSPQVVSYSLQGRCWHVVPLQTMSVPQEVPASAGNQTLVLAAKQTWHLLSGFGP